MELLLHFNILVGDGRSATSPTASWSLAWSRCFRRNQRACSLWRPNRQTDRQPDLRYFFKDWVPSRMTTPLMTQTNDGTTPSLTTALRSQGSVGTDPSVSWSDSLGMLASIGCAIHCAAMPFVIGYLPALGLSFLSDESFHKWMAVACFAIALAAFVPGFRRHGRWTPALIGSVGLAMISIAAFGFAGECCASCSVDTTLAKASINESCPDTCCPKCVPTGVPSPLPAGIEVANQPAVSQTWFEPLVPWLTPLGGLMLVGAHLLNHRSGCPNTCCR